MANLSLLTLVPAAQEELAFKKRALSTAIAAAKGQLIVATDADCSMGSGWLEQIAADFQQRQWQMLVMPVALHAKGTAVGLFDQLEFMTLQGITGASAASGQLSLCNGANLAYQKSAFTTVDGFSGISHIASGDDMLLMHKMQSAFPGQVKYLKSTACIVHTDAAESWPALLQQRIRWAGKAGHYSDKKIMPVLLLVYALNALLLFLPLSWLLLGNGPAPVLLGVYCTAFVLKIGVELRLLQPVAKFFQQENSLWAFPFFQPLHLLYVLLIGLLAKTVPARWKGRKIS
jgi:hypothetical protein